MALPASHYLDPMEVASRREEECKRKESACGQCRERESAQWEGETIVFCGLKRQIYGRRCEHFRKRTIKGEE